MQLIPKSKRTYKQGKDMLFGDKSHELLVFLFFLVTLLERDDQFLVVVDADREIIFRHARSRDLNLEFLLALLDVDGRRSKLPCRHNGEIVIEQVAENARQPGVSSFNGIHSHILQLINS